MKITKITPIGKKKVYDLSVKDVEHYVLANGVVTHNTGIYYSSDNIWIIGRQQEKEGTEVMGYNFIINVEKSRFVKEKSRIPVCVTWEGGISKWGGLLDVAQELGYVTKPSNGWYVQFDPSTKKELTTKKYRADETENEEFWKEIFSRTDFAKAIETRFSVSSKAMIDRITTSTEEDIQNEDH